MFKYETHCHTSIISRCSSFTPQEIVDTYIKNGYSGVCITDHFLNGNCEVTFSHNNESFKTKIEMFFEGFRQVLKIAKGSLKVFPALEYSYKGTDFLTYGLDEEKCSKYPEIMDMRVNEYLDFCMEKGVLVVQAHPFRTANYIDHVRLYEKAEGIETYNACRTDIVNNLAEYYANIYGKTKIGGSDIHHKSLPVLSGMAYDKEINNIDELIQAIRSNQGKIIKQENVLVDI